MIHMWRLKWGTSPTPYSLFWLIGAFASISIVSALLNQFLFAFFQVGGPQQILSLSLWGMYNFYLWQPLTYLFVQQSFFQGITFYFLFAICIKAYLIYSLGDALIEAIGERLFFKLFFFSGLFSALCSLAVLYLTGNPLFVSGPDAAIFALFTLFTLLNPERELLLFLLFPLKVKWLFAALVGGLILINLSQFNLLSLTYYLSGSLIGYLVGLYQCNLRLPFNFLRGCDQFFLSFRKHLLPIIPSKKEKPNSKIYAIKSGKMIVTDEQFMDAMLTKISKHGEKSLSWFEKRKLKKISKKFNSPSGGRGDGEEA